MSVRSHTTYYVEHDGQEFETRLEPVDNTEKITFVGDKAVVSYLSQDDWCGGWYFEEYDQGQFINFKPREMGYKKIDHDEVIELMKEHEGRAFLVNKYDHSGVLYYRATDEQTHARVPDHQWDVSHGCALYIAPDDTPDPVKYCDAVLKEYSDWCNGSIYGVCHGVYVKVNDVWERIEDQDEECWGHIGYDYAEKTLAEEHEHYVKELHQ